MALLLPSLPAGSQLPEYPDVHRCDDFLTRAFDETQILLSGFSYPKTKHYLALRLTIVLKAFYGSHDSFNNVSISYYSLKFQQVSNFTFLLPSWERIKGMGQLS